MPAPKVPAPAPTSSQALPGMGSEALVSMLMEELLLLSFLLNSGALGTATVLTAAGRHNSGFH